MRTVRNNSDGYSILIVLMITVVFTVFILSFIVISANTTKQNEIVEQNLQSVAIAEMGVTYFEQALNNSIHTHQGTVLTYVKNLRTNDRANNINYPDDHYINIAIDEMIRYIETDIKAINLAVGIKDTSNGNFLISPSNSDYFTKSSKGIDISFISTGKEDNKSTTIEGLLKLDFSEFLITKVSPPGDAANTTPILQANRIPDPGNLQTCSNQGKKVEFYNIECQINGSEAFNQNDNPSFTNSTVKITGSLTSENINKDIINSTLYILGDMSAGNMNSLSKINLYIGGALNGMHFNGSGLSNSVVEIKGTASMQNIKLKDSTMYIGGATTIQHINDIESSTLFINADTTITQGIILGMNSLICVNGHLNISGNVNNNGNSKIYAKTSNNTSVITNSDSFNNACFRASTTADWGNINLSSEYDYKYN